MIVFSQSLYPISLFITYKHDVMNKRMRWYKERDVINILSVEFKCCFGVYVEVLKGSGEISNQALTLTFFWPDEAFKRNSVVFLYFLA